MFDGKNDYILIKMLTVEKDDEETNGDEGVSGGDTRNANVQGLDNIGVGRNPLFDFIIVLRFPPIKHEYNNGFRTLFSLFILYLISLYVSAFQTFAADRGMCRVRRCSVR